MPFHKLAQHSIMLPLRLPAGLLPVQAKASNSASSKPTSSAAGGATVKWSKSRARPHSKIAAAASERPRRARSNSTSRRSKAAAIQQQQQQQQQQQHEQPNLSQHLDKLVPAPFQGCRGDLVFKGKLRYAYTQKEAREGLNELLKLADACSSSSPLVVGLDTETAVKWGQRQHGTPTSLLQLCYHAAGSREPVCLLLALHTLGLGRGIAAVLRHPHILKVGIGIAHDMMDLLRSHEADCRVPGMLDLSWLATQCGVIKDASPQDAARQQQMQAAGIKTFQQPLQWGLAGLLQRTSQFSLLKNKRITMSNWSKIPLSEQQLQYAACDAYAGLMAFHALWLLWLQQQPAAAASSTPPVQQPLASSNSSSSSSNSRQGNFGTPATTAAEFDGVLDWLLDKDQQQQEEQPQQQNLPQQTLDIRAAVIMPAAPQPAASTNISSSGNLALHGAIVAAAASVSLEGDSTHLSQPDSSRCSHMPFTIPERHLTDAAFWRSYTPAVDRQQQWQQLLQRGTTAAQLQYDNMIANALDKAVAEDGSDFDRAVPGTPVADAGADAAAAGLLWP